MHNYINNENQYSVSFKECPSLVSQVPAPSLSEIIKEARQTGQMPYSSQRTPVPSYTNDLDAKQFFDGCDRIAGQVNAIRFSSLIKSKETELEEHKQKLSSLKSSAKTPSAEHSGADGNETA